MVDIIYIYIYSQWNLIALCNLYQVIHSSWMFMVVQQTPPLRRTLGGREGGLGRRPNGAAVASTKPRTGRGRVATLRALGALQLWPELYQL